MAKHIPYNIGHRIDMITISSIPRPCETSYGKYDHNYDIVCDCGNVSIRSVRSIKASLAKGYSVSCGCAATEAKRRNGWNNVTHGLTKKLSVDRKLYDVHRQMLRRCYDPNCKDFKAWGLRGISVCDEWRTDVFAFVAWARSSGYGEKVTIERIDVNGNYCPENCTWIPNEKQAANTRILHFLTLNGETHYISEWARVLNVPLPRLKARVRYGWSDERVLTEPVRCRK